MADPFYTEDFIEPDPHHLFLSSRRRIDPQTNDRLKPVPIEEGQVEHPDHIRDQGEQEVIQMTKKDLESLIYQANPALTVKQLSPEPEISFRKFEFDKEKQKQVDTNEDSSRQTEQVGVRGFLKSFSDPFCGFLLASSRSAFGSKKRMHNGKDLKRVDPGRRTLY